MHIMKHHRTAIIIFICFKNTIVVTIAIYAHNVKMVNQILLLKDAMAFKQKLYTF